MRTPLYDRHIALGAKMGEFAGWEVPLYYKGVIAEHMAVRKAVGLFDVSHMGRIDVRGNEAEDFLDYISTNVISERPDYTATYTVFSSESGGCVDDAIVFRVQPDHFYVIVNASNRQSDLEHMQKVARDYDVVLEPHYSTDAILALQGPLSKALLSQLLERDISLKPMCLAPMRYQGEELWVSRTGYTGSLGYELVGSPGLIIRIWDDLLYNGRQDGIEPVGVGARDTLRLEAGYALYGHELSPDIAPTESVSEWTVRWKKANFLGKEALIRLEASQKKRSQHAISMLDKGIPRQGSTVYKGGRVIGKVTSGSFSPLIGHGIGVIMVVANLAIGERVEIDIRGQRLKAEVVKLPFYKVR